MRRSAADEEFVCFVTGAYPGLVRFRAFLVGDRTCGSRSPRLDEAERAPSITSTGRSLFLFGGDRWPTTAQDELRSKAWIWIPPVNPAVTVVTTAPPQTESTTPSTPPLTQASAPPGAPGAPQFVSATGDAAAGRITVRFDRPVVQGSTDDKSTNGAPPSVLAAMGLVVFGADRSGSTPQGNAHEYLAGVGTDTVTTDATSMASGTTYVSIASGFVRSAADGTPNAPVELKDHPRNSAFPALSCIPVKVTGAAPVGPPTSGAPTP